MSKRKAEDDSEGEESKTKKRRGDHGALDEFGEDAPQRLYERSEGKTKFAWTYDQFLALLWLVHSDRNLFVTGGAGSGKRTMAGTMARVARDLLQTDVALLAATRHDAHQACGETAHAWMALPILSSDEAAEESYKKVETRRRWERTSGLVLAYIEHWDALLLETLDRNARSARRDLPHAHVDDDLKKPIKPFGGMRVVITGDFYADEPGVPKKASDRKAKRAFETKTWADLKLLAFNLGVNFRQRGEEFKGIVAQLRIGKRTKTLDVFMQRHLVTSSETSSSSSSSSASKWTPPKFAVALVDKKAELQELNAACMRALEGTASQTFHTAILLDPSASHAKQQKFKEKRQLLLKRCPCPSVVTLQIGMLVRLMFDLPGGEAQRDERGIIESFEPVTRFPLVRFPPRAGMKSRAEVRVPTQQVKVFHDEVGVFQCVGMMLEPAFAVLVNEVYGQTLGLTCLAVRPNMKCDDIYTMISRVADPDHLRLRQWDPPDPYGPISDVHHFYSELVFQRDEPPCPKRAEKRQQKLVDFLTSWSPAELTVARLEMPTQVPEAECKDPVAAEEEASAKAKRLQEKFKAKSESKKRKMQAQIRARAQVLMSLSSTDAAPMTDVSDDTTSIANNVAE